MNIDIVDKGRFIVTCKQLLTLTRQSFISGLVRANPEMTNDQVRQQLKNHASHLSHVMRDAIAN